MIALAFLLVQVTAASGFETMVTIGVGAEPCRTWTLQRKVAGQGRRVDQQWLSGFLTGMDFAYRGLGGKALLRDSDSPNTLIGFVDDYCARRPLDTVATAAQFLWKELAERADR